MTYDAKKKLQIATDFLKIADDVSEHEKKMILFSAEQAQKALSKKRSEGEQSPDVLINNVIRAVKSAVTDTKYVTDIEYRDNYITKYINVPDVKCQEDLKQVNDRLATLSAAYQTLEQQLSDMHKQRVNLLNQIDKLKHQKQTMSEQSQMQTQIITELNNRVAGLEKDLLDNDKQYQLLTMRYQDLSDQHDSIRAQHTTQINTLMTELARCNGELAACQANINGQMAEIHELNTTITTLNERIRNLMTHNEQLNRRNDQLNRQNEQLNQRNDQIILQYNNEINELNQQLTSRDSIIEEQKQQIAELNRRVNEYFEQIARHLITIQQLTDANRELNERLAGYIAKQEADAIAIVKMLEELDEYKENLDESEQVKQELTEQIAKMRADGRKLGQTIASNTARYEKAFAEQQQLYQELQKKCGAVDKSVLERYQAEIAQLRNKVSERDALLNSNERDFMDSLTSLRNELDQYKQSDQTLNAQIKKLLGDKQSLASELKEKVEEISRLRLEIADLHKSYEVRISDLNKQLEIINANKERLIDARIQSLEQSTQRYTNQIDRLESEITGYKEQILIVNQQLRQKEAELGAANSTLVQKEAELGAANSTLVQKEAELGAANSTLVQKEAELGAANAKLKTLQSELSTARDTILNLRTRLDSESDKSHVIDDLKSQLFKVQQIADDLTKQLEQVKSQGESDSKTNEDAEFQDNTALIDQIKLTRRLETQINELNIQIAEYGRAKSNLNELRDVNYQLNEQLNDVTRRLTQQQLDIESLKRDKTSCTKAIAEKEQELQQLQEQDIRLRNENEYISKVNRQLSEHVRSVDAERVTYTNSKTLIEVELERLKSNEIHLEQRLQRKQTELADLNKRMDSLAADNKLKEEQLDGADDDLRIAQRKTGTIHARHEKLMIQYDEILKTIETVITFLSDANIAKIRYTENNISSSEIQSQIRGTLNNAVQKIKDDAEFKRSTAEIFNSPEMNEILHGRDKSNNDKPVVTGSGEQASDPVRGNKRPAAFDNTLFVLSSAAIIGIFGLLMFVLILILIYIGVEIYNWYQEPEPIKIPEVSF